MSLQVHCSNESEEAISENEANHSIAANTEELGFELSLLQNADGTVLCDNEVAFENKDNEVRVKVVQDVHTEDTRICDKLNNVKDINGEKSKNQEHSGKIGEKPEYHLTQLQPKSSCRNKENHEVSPFKESVKGFVFGKLSKKFAAADSGSTTLDHDKWPIFSGLKERLAKTLEDKIGKDSLCNAPLESPCNKSEKTKIGKTEDFIAKVNSESTCFNDVESSHSLACELKSVVANDQTESTPIEEAAECFEELKTTFSEPEDIEKCIANMADKSPPSTPPTRSRTLQNLAAAAHSMLTPKKGKGKELPMSFSTLKKTKGLDDDESLIEETEDLLIKEVDGSKTSEVMIDSNSADSHEDVAKNNSSSSCFLLEEQNNRRHFTDYILEMLQTSFYLICKLTNAICSPLGFHSLVVVFAIMAWQFFPFTSYSAGFVNGLGISSLILHFYSWLTKKSEPKKSLCFPEYKMLPPLTIPVSPVQKPSYYTVWMNELQGDYDPESYRLCNTNTVAIRLEGSTLKLSRAKFSVPKRAMWNENKVSPPKIYQFQYSLLESKIMLVPEGLQEARVWNRKYPLCLIIPDASKKQHSPQAERKMVTPSQEPSLDKHKTAKSLPNSLSGSPSHLANSSHLILYLFTRTDREKEEWYWRFLVAIKYQENLDNSKIKTSLETSTLTSDMQSNLSLERNELSCSGTATDVTNTSGTEESLKAKRKKPRLDFHLYMTTLLRREAPVSDDSSLCDIQWLNVFLGRLFYDFLTQELWSTEVKERIQRKLSKIRLLSYMDELRVTDIYLGTALPQISRTSQPVMDERGLWLDLDIQYKGSFQMTLETKLNLTGAKKSIEMTDFASQTLTPQKKQRYRFDQSDEDDSDDMVESEEECFEIVDNEDSSAPQAASGTGKKFRLVFEKVLHSRCFQSVAENKYVKRVVEELSNTPLVLTVEVKGLIGTLALNIPPLPTDRLWYGFRTNPELSLSAYPKLGRREINYSHITDMIEKRLLIEFQKVFVMPNMDDLLIPIMHSDVYDKQ